MKDFAYYKERDCPMSEEKERILKLIKTDSEEKLPVIDYEEEYRKQTGKDLQTGEYVTQ